MGYEVVRIKAERNSVNLKIKLWIEDKNRNLLFGGGKTKILTQLDKTGCAKETAKQNNMTHENVMKHINILENNVEEDLVLRIHGKNENEVTKYMLSVDARLVLQAYEILNYDVKKFALKRFKELYENK